METVFRMAAIEVKTFLQLADFNSTGPVCRFFRKTSYRIQQPKAFCLCI
ncbi:hypothetical protein SAMN02787081_00401 [Lysinibacillus fusiformis]|uniref:Uncharacterized protein n=1 Tax=Lysinibacillus fusiformis TaxID=28031 RepID=A0A1H8ZYC5_9BACI|nr:hypothetical protein SAMN02787081_00401 [Lysinibacillus fusiformis]SEM84330.1 hypothetical protein SAMN02787103_00401 [Lysinibacillus fusiformis]SEP69429.1 hypothetical protein SAMN02787113_00357 [Lysinibacillus fusiformis]